MSTDLSLEIEVFLNLRIVTETSCSKSQPLRLSDFLEELVVSILLDGFSWFFGFGEGGGKIIHKSHWF